METRMMPRPQTFLLTAAVLVFTCGLHAQIRTPEFRIHDRGDVWDTMKDNGMIGAPSPTDRFEYYPGLDWPGGPHALVTKDEQRSYNYQAGMWIGGKKSGTQVFFTENGPFTYVDNGTFSAMQEQTNFIGSPTFNRQKPKRLSRQSGRQQKGCVSADQPEPECPGVQHVHSAEYQITNQSTS
jgi:hypothetical protein